MTRLKDDGSSGPTSNPAGAGARISVAGAISGRQSAGSWLAEISGSWAKAQPPSAGKVGARGVFAERPLRNPTPHPAPVFAIVRIAAQELHCEARPIKAVQLFLCFHGSPKGCRHKQSPLQRLSEDIYGKPSFFSDRKARLAQKLASCGALLSIIRSRRREDSSLGVAAIAAAVPAGADSPVPSSSGRAPDGCHAQFWRAPARSPDRARR